MIDSSSVTPKVRTNPSMTDTPEPRRSRLRTLVIAGAAAAGLSACAQDAPQDTWAPAGDNAQQIHDLQWPVFLLAGIVGLIVMAVVAFVVVKFKDRGQPIPEQTHGKAWLEYLFIAIPAVILVSIAVPTVSVVIALSETDDTECVVNVTGQQWWWEYDYPVDADGMICGEYQNSNGDTVPIITSGQMVIPTDTNVLIRGTSRDVIHSFWVPQFLKKLDMIPGRVNTFQVVTTEEGVFQGKCAELCGAYHSQMLFQVEVVPQAEYDQFVADLEASGNSGQLSNEQNLYELYDDPQRKGFYPSQDEDIYVPGDDERVSQGSN